MQDPRGSNSSSRSCWPPCLAHAHVHAQCVSRFHLRSRATFYSYKSLLVPRGWQGSSPTRALRTDLPAGAAQGGGPASSRRTVGPRGRQAVRALPGEWGSDDWGPKRGGGGGTQPGSALAPIYALASTSALRAVLPHHSGQCSLHHIMYTPWGGPLRGAKPVPAGLGMRKSLLC